MKFRTLLASVVFALCVYAATDESLAKALVRSAERGLDVHIAIDCTQAAGTESVSDLLLEKFGPQRVVFRTGKGLGVMQEKMAIFDDLTVTLGRFNWTDNARDNNWENMIVIRDATLAARCLGEFQRVWNSPARSLRPNPKRRPKPAARSPKPSQGRKSSPCRSRFAFDRTALPLGMASHAHRARPTVSSLV